MPTHEVARYVYPIIDVNGQDISSVQEPRKNQKSSATLSLCAPADQAPGGLAHWRKPETVVETADLPESIPDELVMLSAPNSPAAKGYRLLRHRLLGAGDPRILAVSSALSGEGKSICAINLALAIGEEVGLRVLLLECNLRKPALSKLLGFVPAQCFSVQMANLDGLVRSWNVTKLDGTRVEVAAIDPALPERPKLDRVLFSTTVADLKSEFDYIVVDTPAVLESADVNLIAESVDGVIMVARSRKSRRASLRAAVEQLGQNKVLGVVLLDSNKRELACT